MTFGTRCVALLLLLHGSTAHAQTSDLEALLAESIVSTPSRAAESATSAPATSSVITAEELRAHGLRSLDEAINYASLGMVTTNPEHAVEVGARGVLLTSDYGNHILLLIDGVPANEPWNGTAYFERGAGVPFEMVDHIEVTLGPGSVMYGGQAMLGVINIVTKRARDYNGVRLILEGDTTAPVFADGQVHLSPLSAYGAGYRLGAGFGHTFTLGGEPAEFTMQVELYRQDGPDWQIEPQSGIEDSVTLEPKDFGPRTPAGSWGGTATRSSYLDAPAAYARLAIGDFTAKVRAGMYTRASPYMDGITNAGDDFDDADNHERDRWLQLDLDYQHSLSPHVAVSARLYGLLNDYRWFSRRSAVEECPDENSVGGCDRDLTADGLSGGTDLRLSLDEPAINGATTLGIDGRLRYAASMMESVDRVTGAIDPFDNQYARTDGLVAPYLQQTVAPTTWLDLNAGVRLDYDTRFGARLSPRAAIGVSAWRGGRLKAIYSEAFRAPTPYELNYADPVEQIAAPDLGAETVRSAELSMEQRFGTHRMFFGVFHSTWTDMVAFQTLSDEQLQAAIDSGALLDSTDEGYEYANIGSITNYGYNAAYEGTIGGKLHLGTNITSAYSRRDLGDGSGSQELTVGPSFFGNARVSYDLGSGWPTLAIAARYAAKRPADRAFDGGFARAPYAPADLQLRFTISGAIPGVAALRYRLSGTYGSAAAGPYVVGVNQYAEDETTVAALQPLRRMSGFVGLEYVIE